MARRQFRQRSPLYQYSLRIATLVALGGVVLAQASCGGDSNGGVVTPPAGGTITTVNVVLSDPTLQIGSLAQAVASARDVNNGVVVIGNRPLTWSSTNTSVATVSADGTITTAGVGTTQIRASVTEGSTMVVGNATFTVTGIPGAPLTANVSMPGLTFSPSDVVVKANGTVRFVFPSLEHNVTWRPRVTGSPADIAITASQTVSRTFPTVGVFPYVCTLHDGMRGTVIVSP